MVKSFLKWAGGKSRLLPELTKYLPERIESYIEPFTGGGAMFFEVINGRVDAPKVWLNDSNVQLMDAYRIVRDDPYNLLAVLEDLQANHSVEQFYKVRDRYNERRAFSGVLAAYFIYLNKTCYNGLYRHNRLGYFNVPMGDYKKPNICDEKGILAASKALQGVKLSWLPFEEVLPYRDYTFAYFDPPYHKEKPTSFTRYTSEDFGEVDHVRLRDHVLNLLHVDGVQSMISNSDTPFINALYSGEEFHIHRIEAPRSINSNGLGRQKVSELIITTY